MVEGILTEAVFYAIAVVGILAAVAEGLVEYLIAPLWDRYELEGFWLRYWAWGVALGLSLAAGINVFQTIIPIPVVGLVLTAVLCARGSNFFHGVINRAEAKPGG